MDPVAIIGLVAAIIALVDKTTQISKALLKCKAVDKKLASLFSRLSTVKLPLLRIILEELKRRRIKQNNPAARASTNRKSSKGRSKIATIVFPSYPRR
jgi:hypothetical protein